jgi:hypothetical protein
MSVEKYFCIFVKIKIGSEKIVYFLKKYDMSGKMFVCSQKLRYLRTFFGMSGTIYQAVVMISKTINYYCMNLRNI